MMKQKLIVLTGPTAVGKSALSVKLAQKIDAQIISADSMQVYKYMDIGTAKVTKEEMQGIPHYLISVLDPKEEFNVCRFVSLAKEAVKSITAQGKIPLIVGGTGFYIHALLYDTDFSDSSGKTDYRSELETMQDTTLHEKLSAVDPVSAETIHPNNRKRMIRALEYYYETNSPISLHNQMQRQKESPYDFRYFVLTDERQKVYERIDARVDQMIDNGLVNEVKRLQEMGYNREMVSMQGIGYKEILDHLQGQYDLSEAVRIIKRDSRHYAKRQMTWFRREKDVIFINKKDYAYDDEKILSELLKNISNINTE